MSDTALAPRAVPWEYQGKGYLLGHTDLDLELLFQTAHERWARNRLEARREGLPEDVYFADLSAYHDQTAGNAFAFGGPLSLRFLATTAGQVEYLLLKLQKGAAAGGERATRDFLLGLLRDDRAAWDRLVGEVLARDFPLVFRVALPSAGQATPSRSTGGSVSSSRASPAA